MKYAGNDKGIALVMVLLLSTIALAIMAGLIYMITAGTQASGLQKRYKTAHDAGIGGIDLTFDLIDQWGSATGQTNFINSLNSLLLVPPLNAQLRTPDGFIGLPAPACAGTNKQGANFQGIAAKVRTSTSSWANCDSQRTIDISAPTSYDWQFELGTAPLRYRVYSKIVHTIEGNTGGGGGEQLWKKGVIMSGGGSGEVPVAHRPYLYTIDLDVANTTSVMERARFTVLYQY